MTTHKEELKLALELLAVGTFHSPELQAKRTEVIEQGLNALAQPEQEPVAWPCVIAEADFSENTITLTMQCTDYKVSAGKHWLSNTPPQRTWVGLSDDEFQLIYDMGRTPAGMMEMVEAKLKEKNA